MRRLLFPGILLLSLACNGGGALERVGTLTLEETDSARVRAPMVEPDPRGGYLMIDRDAGQVRRYGTDGQLLWAHGRRGSGPGEYDRLAGVARLMDGTVLVLEVDGAATIVDSAGTRALRTWNTGLRNVERAVVVDDSLVLTSGWLFPEPSGPRLHLLHLRRGTPVVAFFAPFDALEAKLLATNLFYVPIARSADELAAVFPATDTVYFFSLDGTDRGKLPFPTDRFRRAEASTPEVMTNRSLRAAYLQSIHLVTDLEWLASGNIVVSYWSLQPPGAAAAQRPRSWHHVLVMDRNGTRIAEDSVAGRMLARTARGDTLLFADPGAAARLNKLIVR
jgi:hypothetical protein